MIVTVIRNDHAKHFTTTTERKEKRMVSAETIAAMIFIEKLAARTEDGIIPFSKATGNEPGNPIYYDDKNPIKSAHGSTSYPIVCDNLIDELHHDIIDVIEPYWFNTDEAPVVWIDDDDGYASVNWNFEDEGITFELEDGNISIRTDDLDL